MVPKRRKVGNLTGLAVLVLLMERPMHPYEMASNLRGRGKHYSMAIKWGSLYTVVQNLEKHGFIAATGSTRQGRRPERTVYAITDAGRVELDDWLRELVGVPEPDTEHLRFEAALSEIAALPPDDAIELLTYRLRALDSYLTTQEAGLKGFSREVPRLFLIEVEYKLALVRAEAEWIRALLKELEDGSMPGVKEWRAFHETGQAPSFSTDPEATRKEAGQDD